MGNETRTTSEIEQGLAWAEPGQCFQAFGLFLPDPVLVTQAIQFFIGSAQVVIVFRLAHIRGKMLANSRIIFYPGRKSKIRTISVVLVTKFPNQAIQFLLLKMVKRIALFTEGFAFIEMRPDFAMRGFADRCVAVGPYR